MKIRSKDDFKLTGIISERTWSDIVFFSKLIAIIFFSILIKTMSFLTRFFPFSLLFQDKAFHYKNRDIRMVMEVVSNACEKAKKKFIVEKGEKDQYFFYIIGYFIKSKKRIRQSLVLKKIEKKFNLPEGNVFIRKYQGNRVRFLIPVEVNPFN